MPKSPACWVSEKTSATRRIAFAGMQASFRQRPPTSPFSTTAVFIPSWAARIAATYPPGPEPITMQSYCSGIRAVTLAGDQQDHRDDGAADDDDPSENLGRDVAAVARADLRAG